MPAPSKPRGVALPEPVAPRSEPASQVRIRLRSPRDEHGPLVDEIGNEQLTFTVDLLCLENAVDVVPYDPSTRAAAATLDERIEDLATLRDAINSVYLDLFDPRVAMAMCGPGAPLARYLRGLFAWSRAVITALEGLSFGLRTLSPDWLELRTSLDEASLLYPCELENAIDVQFVMLRLKAPELDDPKDPLHDFGEHLEELFAAAGSLKNALNQRFG